MLKPIRKGKALAKGHVAEGGTGVVAKASTCASAARGCLAKPNDFTKSTVHVRFPRLFPASVWHVWVYLDIPWPCSSKKKFTLTLVCLVLVWHQTSKCDLLLQRTEPRSSSPPDPLLDGFRAKAPNTWLPKAPWELAKFQSSRGSQLYNEVLNADVFFQPLILVHPWATVVNPIINYQPIKRVNLHHPK